MDTAHVKALAAELEHTLGLLRELVVELGNHRDQWLHSGRVPELVTRLSSRPNLEELPAVLLRAHGEISEIMGGIRLTRAAVEAQAVERIRDTKNKLSDVTSTTESATLELMNGLDSALAIIGRLEGQSAPAAGSGFQDLRAQLSALYNHLQFQDITAQQLQGVSHSLLDLETRVAAVAALFDQALPSPPPPLTPAAPVAESSAHLAFNPEATMHRSAADQAAIDETFRGAQHEPAAEPSGARR